MYAFIRQLYDGITASGVVTDAEFTAFQANLADTSSASNGDALVGVLRTISGAVATTEHAWHEGQPYSAKADFGVLFDNSTNNQTGMAAALAGTRDLQLLDGAARVGTGNLAPVAGQTIKGQGRERTFLRCTHASNPVFSTTAAFVTYQDMTVDRTAGVAGQGINHAAGSGSIIEGFKALRVNCNGHASGIRLRNIVIASIEEAYLQSGTIGLDTDKDGSDFATMLSVKKTWLRGNTSRGAFVGGTINSHFDQVAFEGSGVHTPVGVEVSGGSSHLFTACWWEDVVTNTFASCGSVRFNGGKLDGTTISGQAFYFSGSGTTAVFDGAWHVANLGVKTFAVADGAGVVIYVRSPDLLSFMFSAVNGGKVIYDVPLEAKATFNPASINSLTLGGATTVTLTGVVLGDLVEAWFENGTNDPASFLIKATVLSTNTVTIGFFNLTAGAIDLASGTISVRAQKRALIS